MSLTTAQRFCDEANTIRVMVTRSGVDGWSDEAIRFLERAGLSGRGLAMRYSAGARHIGDDSTIEFVDGSVAVQDALSGRWADV